MDSVVYRSDFLYRSNEGTKMKSSGSRHLIVILAIFLAVATPALCGDWPNFRGPDRDGKSTDTGLMKQWPEGGPKELWAFEGLGHGFASATVAGGMIYTTGLEENQGVLYALDLDGNLKWKKPYGAGWTGGHPGTRTTPTVSDGLVYVISGHGRVVCLDAATGDEKWAVDGVETFGARKIGWGLAESPLVAGGMVFFTPGGDKAGLVALDKKTGKVAWACKEINEQSGYCSPVLIKRGATPLILTLTGKALVGVDARSGKLLWSVPRGVPHDIQAVTPVYQDGMIYITSGYGGERGQMMELSATGAAVRPVWTDKKLDCHHGGVIALDGHVYGASDRNSGGNWICLDLKTGEVLGETRAVGKGSIAYADGMFYGYGENGQVGLIDPALDNFALVSSFKITRGTGPHWAHPVIAGGRLYIRHSNALMAFDITAPQPEAETAALTNN